jgi:hypothetical protein
LTDTGTRRASNSVTEDDCDTYTYFAGVQLRVQANQLIPFYIESPLTEKIVAMRQAILTIKEGLVYLSLNLI